MVDFSNKKILGEKALKITWSESLPNSNTLEAHLGAKFVHNLKKSDHFRQVYLFFAFWCTWFKAY